MKTNNTNNNSKFNKILNYTINKCNDYNSEENPHDLYYLHIINGRLVDTFKIKTIRTDINYVTHYINTTLTFEFDNNNITTIAKVLHLEDEENYKIVSIPQYTNNNISETSEDRNYLNGIALNNNNINTDNIIIHKNNTEIKINNTNPNNDNPINIQINEK